MTEVVEVMSVAETAWVEWFNAQNGVPTPNCNCGHDGMGPGWHVGDCRGAHAALAAKTRDLYLAVGPATEWALELFVPGRAAPQGSKNGIPIYQGRGAARVFTGKVAQVESSKAKVDQWRADVRQACMEVWRNRPALDGPLVLEVEFIRQRPVAAPKRRTPFATTTPDASKLVRSTEDAITSAGVWADDARVVLIVAGKRVAEIGETPGAWIAIRQATAADVRPRTGGTS